MLKRRVSSALCFPLVVAGEGEAIAVLSPGALAQKERGIENIEIQQFISKKADLLFSQSWKTNVTIVKDGNEENENCYAIMPPLEQFMEIPSAERRELFFRDIERGDIVIGRISSIREFGFFMALCPLRDVPSQSSHGDPLSYYQNGDLIQGKRSIDVASSLETYEKVLHNSLGFANPAVVEFLGSKLGLDESSPPSLMRGLQSVKIGVDYFKEGRHVDAMNEYNKALEIDAQNVEALVARGALYATKGSLNKAIEDFEIALEQCPTHRNARKYLCQTLVERGGQLEEEEKLLNAESYYKKALNIDEGFQEAEEALLKLRQQIQKSLEIREKQAAKEERQKEKKVETSAEKLRKLLKEEKRLKKKRKKSTSSSSCDPSSDDSASSSSSSSSDNKKRKKRSRNRSESSSSSKKHTSRMFSHPSRKEDSYSPPANTSASFLNQKHEVEKLLERQDRLANQKPEVRDREGDCVFLKMYAEDDLCGGKFEDSRDSRHHSKTRANSSKTERQSRSDRASSNRRDSTGSYYRQSDDRNKASDSGRLEKELGRREGYHKFSPSQAKYSTSPTGSDYSSKSAERYKQYTSRWMNEPSRYNADGRAEAAQGKCEKESKNRERDAPGAKGGDEEALLNGKEQLGSGAKKQLPQNLLNIFNQIAEFEREKGSKQKNQ
ncbi:Tetratricopeptide repeat protein 14, partial [Ophiophagus hannah]